ncbi:protein ROS1-like isoform X1 [Iris pallida]|uniref:Protein ROS1-like isoform X1 n=1 Tax=Iris pallida TaxID=29817 RepID=A0AAX6EWN2_IRIPA|nr:protein ROS1-like isoform X1 [Iris pallida]
MGGGPDSSSGPSNWRQAVAASPSQQMPPCCSNGGEMRTQSFNNPMQMSYRTLLALSDPVITSNMTNLAPLLRAQMGGHGNGSQMMPPASPNQNQLSQLVARERNSLMMPPAFPNQNQLSQVVARESSQMMPPASPNQNQLAQLVAHESSSQMMPHASPNQNQVPPCSSNGGETQTQSFNNLMQMSYRTLLALSDPAITSNMTNLAPLLLAQMAGHHGSGSQMMPPASPNQNQLAQIFARESSSQMIPPASPNQNQLAQLVARERSSQTMPRASPNQNQLAQLVTCERNSQMMPHASPNQSQLAQLVARERSSQMMPPASPNLNQLAQLIARERSRQMMPPASPNQNQLAACESSSQVTPPASLRRNRFFLNGNSVPASSNSSSNNLPPQPLTPKAQYGLPVPLLPDLNSLPDTHTINTVVSNSVVSPETPADFGKNTRSQDFRAVEIIDLVDDDTATSQNNHHNRFCQQTAVQEALLSFSGPGMSSNIVALQQQEGEMNVTPPAEISLQQAEGENPGIDLNKTPEPKPKRKKHRPKVIREGKAAKTTKPVTPKPVTPRRAKKTENPPQAKRKYVWKKNPWQNEYVSVPQDRKSPSFDLNSSTNPWQDEYVSVPQTPNSPPQPSRQEMMRANQIQAEYIRMLNSITRPHRLLEEKGKTWQDEYVSVPQTPNSPPQPSRQEMMRANQIQDEYIRMLNSITRPHRLLEEKGKT